MTWSPRLVGELFFEVTNGRSVRQDKSTVGYAVSRIESISNGEIDSTRVGWSTDPIEDSDPNWLRSGDILFSHINSPNRVGNVALYQGEPERLFHGINLLRLRPRIDMIDSRFAIHLLRSNGFRSQLRKFVNQAVNQASVSTANLKSICVLVPPIEEQRRIAAVLDAADALRAKRRQAIAKLDTLTQAIFIDMFGGGSSVPTMRLGDAVTTTSGGTPSRSRPEFFGGPIPWVKSGELDRDIVLTTEEAITEEAVRRSSAKVMAPGTVLLAMYGATVGESAVLGIQAATNQAVCCLMPNETVQGPYLLGFLRAAKPNLIRSAAGGAQPNISQGIVRDLELPVPDVALQHEYALRSLAVANQRSRLSTQMSSVDTLFASLQQRAFLGEL